jgi:hypothetical protein
MRTLAIVVAIVAVTACHRHTTLNPDAEFCGVTEPKLRVPQFQIKVDLPDAAMQKLLAAGGTLNVLASFDGDGTPLNGEYTAPNRAVILGCYQFQTTQTEIVSVTKAYISAEAFKRLSDTDYYVTVNISSGQRAAKSNVFIGGFAVQRISQASRTPMQIEWYIGVP